VALEEAEKDRKLILFRQAGEFFLEYPFEARVGLILWGWRGKLVEIDICCGRLLLESASRPR
jgi:hypothetical protein